MQNPTLYPVLGDYNPETRTRTREPTFKSLLEIRAKGVYYFYENLAEVIDAYGRGENILEMAKNVNDLKPPDNIVQLAA